MANMSGGLTKHHILEAIDKLRSRKSRPDAMRITCYVAKKYEFPRNTIKEYLEELCNDGTVLKVEFKGNTSYRNASKYRNVGVAPSNEQPNVIAEQIGYILAEMVVDSPHLVDAGISPKALYDQINRNEKKCGRKLFQQVLDQEVANNNLLKYENGNYCLGYQYHGQTSQNTMDSAEASENSLDSSEAKFNEQPQVSSPESKASSHFSPEEDLEVKNVRPVIRTYCKTPNEPKAEKFNSEQNSAEVLPLREGSRRKRVQKVVFDPSDSPKPKKPKETKEQGVAFKKLKITIKTPKKQEFEQSEENLNEKGSSPLIEKEEKVSDSSDSEDSQGICVICHYSIDVKPPGSVEKLVSCASCSKHAHMNCIDESQHLTRVKFNKWQCSDCKPCVVCKDNKVTKEAAIITCGICLDGYHIKCTSLKKGCIPEVWLCNKCAGAFTNDSKPEKYYDTGADSVGSTSNATSQRSSPEPEKESPAKKPLLKGEVDETVPDCTDWTVEETYKYFLDYVDAEDAEVFRDQEIDGKILLLLSRYDVLSDLKLKLGPALKVFAVVRKLQLRRSDQHLFWP